MPQLSCLNQQVSWDISLFSQEEGVGKVLCAETANYLSQFCGLEK